jgi:hypothetical protein
LCGGLAQGDATFAFRNEKLKAMLGNLITLALSALAVWFLVDSAIEFVRDGQEDNLITEP